MKNGKNGKNSRPNSFLGQPPLTREEEYELFERIKKGDEPAKAEIVEAHYGFVCDIANQFRGPDWSDLVQEGCIGLMRAIRKYDHTRGNRFITYAGYWVRAYMLMEVRRYYQGSRSPGAKYVVMREIRKHSRVYVNLHGHYPDIDQLSELTGKEQSTIMSVLSCDMVMPSISMNKDEDDSQSWRLSQEALPDTNSPSPLDRIEARESRNLVAELKQELSKALIRKKKYSPARDVDITFKYILEDISQAELARKYDISRERARQIVEGSTRILRQLMMRRQRDAEKIYRSALL